jgi:sortase A
MKKKTSTILLVLLFLAGLSLLLYPSVSDAWNAKHQSGIITEYEAEVSVMDDSVYEEALKAAQAYNKTLAATQNGSLELSDAMRAQYETMLDVTEDHVMGYVEIPSIKVTLPIYHGTDDAALEAGVGHIEGSSLPVGGESTHCVISGHRGLPSAKLFTNLDQLNVGDTFMLHTLRDTLTYEVDQILIVEPDDTSALMITKGEDLCTLVTCTPYGVNTHRLLVRGHRVPNVEGADLRVTADAIQLDPLVVAPFAAVPILLVMLFLILRSGKKQKAKEKRKRLSHDQDDHDGPN